MGTRGLGVCRFLGLALLKFQGFRKLAGGGPGGGGGRFSAGVPMIGILIYWGLC